MELLLDRRGHNITITKEVFLTAAACRQLGILNLLTRRDIVIPVNDEWISIANFYNAVKVSDTLRIKKLLREGGWVAAEEGYKEIVEVLTQRTDVDVNSISRTRRSPIFWPSAYGYERIVAILIAAGARSDIVDEDGDTAITISRKRGHR
ncbi:ankyrin repeat-containing protein [Dactylonectria estremocensis]|uniref:Ankyrin repeat-containing protein n=1 Tax=Dactylonectria estremocensis TaxID=1079267 RepID=A0A9P9EML0_9HYPO|nr:ankyrin repeat-containing protein [Dactylonectria estremocensis]